MIRLLIGLTPLTLLVLASCTREVGAPSADFGNAVTQNINVQIVNPDAPTSDGIEGHDAGRISVGQGRYIHDKVEKPRRIGTTTVGGDDGGGGDGGGE